MQVVRIVTKKRSEYGKPCVKFAEQRAEVSLSIENKCDGRFGEEKFYLSTGIQLHPQYSEHEVNTERCNVDTKEMVHLEGGWPKDVSLDDPDQLKRYRKKVEKDENFLLSLFKLASKVEECARQHIAVDIYEKDVAQDAFNESESRATHSTRLTTFCVVKDPNAQRRPIVAISWNPADPNKIAFGMSSQLGQGQSDSSNSDDFVECLVFVFDCDKPQKAMMQLACRNKVTAMAFNPKDSTQLLVGCQNGFVVLYDTRRGTPLGTFLAHKSPVQSVVWLQTKSGAEFITGGQDGLVKWWDTRKMGEDAAEILEVTQTADRKNSFNTLVGVTCTEFDSTMPTKLLVGTEGGVIFQANRKGKTPTEKLGQSLKAFDGHVDLVLRNPFFPKFFLTSCHSNLVIWCDDVKESPIMNFKPLNSSLADACWSPTRPTIVYLALKNGTVEVFDILQSLESPIECINICKEPLCAVKINHTGKRIAVSSTAGKMFLLDVPESLSVLKKNEKTVTSTFLEREQRKEKLVEASIKESSSRVKSGKKEKPKEDEFSLELDATAEADFEEEQGKIVQETSLEAFEIFEEPEE